MDKKAKNILFKTYWSGSGWKDDRYTDPKDFEYAKEKGLMFDKLTISHDECISRIMEIASAITQEQVARSFLSSLSTRRLDWRSGIGSFYIAKLFTLHSYTPAASGYSCENSENLPVSHTCRICRDLKYGVIGQEYYINEDLNVLNFERIKWGGVRHGDLLYTLFDLEQFSKEQVPEPTGADIEILKGILDAAASCHPGDHPGSLRDRLRDIPEFKSNRGERSVILELLTCIEVLKPMSYDRQTPGKHDFIYVTFWRGEDGYNEENVRKYFGRYLK